MALNYGRSADDSIRKKHVFLGITKYPQTITAYCGESEFIVNLIKLHVYITVALVTLGAAALISMEDVPKTLDTYECPWAPGAVLRLSGWRGNISVRTYKFEDMETRLPYEIKGDGYRQCVRTPGAISPKDRGKEKKNGWKGLIGAIFLGMALLGVFMSPMVDELEYDRQRRVEEREYEQAKLREARERHLELEQRREETKKRQQELAVERARSKAAHEERLERKRAKREELEARTRANAERRKK